MRVYLDLANGSDFHFGGVLSLNLRLLPRASWEGGVPIVPAAAPVKSTQ
jgi:hypothetical protein